MDEYKYTTNNYRFIWKMNSGEHLLNFRLALWLLLKEPTETWNCANWFLWFWKKAGFQSDIFVVTKNTLCWKEGKKPYITNTSLEACTRLWRMVRVISNSSFVRKYERKSKADLFKGFGAYMNQKIVYRIIVQPKYLHMGFIRTQPQISFTWP